MLLACKELPVVASLIYYIVIKHFLWRDDNNLLTWKGAGCDGIFNGLQIEPLYSKACFWGEWYDIILTSCSRMKNLGATKTLGFPPLVLGGLGGYSWEISWFWLF